MIDRLPVPVGSRVPTGTTNAYLVGDPPEVLVDPAARTDALDESVGTAAVTDIVVTHTHPDHVGAVAAYARECGARTWALAGREQRFASRVGHRPDRVYREGTEIGPLTVMATPGHAPDHVAYVFGESAVVGDVAVAAGSVFVGGSDGDVRAYLTSLRRLLVRGFDTVYPGHGAPIDEPEAALTRLLAHRLDRERRVLAAVRGGAEELAAVTRAAYDRDLSGVEDLARAATAAHLEKLARAGAIEWDGERAAPVE